VLKISSILHCGTCDHTQKMETLKRHLLILVIIGITMSFSSVKGWCVDNGYNNRGTHIELSECHSDFLMRDASDRVNVETAHSTDNPKCTTCYDTRPDIIAAKVIDDSFGSLVPPPLCNSIFPPQEYSDIVYSSIPSPGYVLTFDQSSWRRQTQQSIRAVVLLI